MQRIFSEKLILKILFPAQQYATVIVKKTITVFELFIFKSECLILKTLYKKCKSSKNKNKPRD